MNNIDSHECYIMLNNIYNNFYKMAFIKEMLFTIENMNKCKLGTITNWFIIVLLWFYRFVGLSFGGITVDTNGNISSKKIYKIYGYLIAICILVGDIYQFYLYVNEREENEKFFPKGVAKSSKAIIEAIFTANKHIWLFYKLTCLYLFNHHGFTIVKFIIENLHKCLHKPHITQLIIVVLFWLSQILTLLGISIFTVIRTKGENFIISNNHNFSTTNFNMTFVYFWTIPAITWIISIIYSAILDQFINNIKVIGQIETRGKELSF